MQRASAPTLGVDLGGSAIKWLVLDEANATILEGQQATPTAGTDAVVDAIAEVVAQVEVDVAAVGVAIPGVFDADGCVTLLPNIPGGWTGFPFAATLEARLGRPAALANDGNAFALAELRLGAGRGANDLVAIVLGTGIGGGVAVGGRVHLGTGMAGEVGHIVVDPTGPLCGCGAHGCLEVYASAPSIRAQGARILYQGVDSSLRERCGGDVGRLTSAMVLDAARDGDPFARDVARTAGRALGRCVASLSNVLAPEVVVFGGGVAQNFDLLEPHVLAVMDEHVMVPPPALARASIGPMTGALGAAIWAHERPDRMVVR